MQRALTVCSEYAHHSLSMRSSFTHRSSRTFQGLLYGYFTSVSYQSMTKSMYSGFRDDTNTSYKNNKMSEHNLLAINVGFFLDVGSPMTHLGCGDKNAV